MTVDDLLDIIGRGVTVDTIEIIDERENKYKDKDFLYFLLYGGEVVYVGHSYSNVFSRVNGHINDKNKLFNRVVMFPNPVDIPAQEVERALISYFRGKYNKKDNVPLSEKTMNIIAELMRE